MEVIQVKKYKNYEVRAEFDETAEMGTPEACIVKNAYSKDGKFLYRWPKVKGERKGKIVDKHER